ncbi:MAG TPA: T9SS type A sorting domain-containing protein [Saprospiraceae bacterium]|nr:T9SS type A sorting domain-containing protein [Saprospiraceae bacterium]HMQ84556.1 T9SS type A sorting domain-containing protein [Saprospiraceae bacterium]
MKKMLLTALFGVVFGLLLQAQEIEVPQSNRPLITKRTAEWCPHCGTWGWTMFENLLLDNEDDALVLSAHYSGSYMNTVSLEITNNFGGFSQPRFYLNNQDQNATSSNGTTVRNNVRSQVSDLNTQPPVAQTGLRVFIEDNQLRVKTQTQFFQEGQDGDYYLGIYLIERSYVGSQAGYSGQANHKNMLSKSLLGGSFGELLQSGTIANGSTFEKEAVVTYNDIAAAFENGTYNENNVEIATIIWRKEGNTYRVVNTNSSNELEIASGTTAPTLQAAIKVLPNVVQQQAEVFINLPAALSQAELSLWSLDGRQVQLIHKGNLASGASFFTLDRANLSSGVYFLRLTDGTKVATSRVILQ